MKHGRPSTKIRALRKSGFRKRMKTTDGRNVLQRRRLKKRSKICGVCATK